MIKNDSDLMHCPKCKREIIAIMDKDVQLKCLKCNRIFLYKFRGKRV